jgi:Leucine-rich repeat (LRR) protein
LLFSYFHTVTLDLDDNLFGGSLPNLSAAGGLVDLRLGGNAFDAGPIPNYIFDLADLRTVHLHNLGLTGVVPATITNLVNLEALWLEDNALSGTFPDLSGATGLMVLRLTSNAMTGVIPEFLMTLSGLLELWLGENAFTGSIPEVIGDMTQLQLLAMQGNQLSGGIPSTLPNLVNLGKSLSERWLCVPLSYPKVI